MASDPGADDRAYLAALSAHPGRLGDTSYLNPAFASKLAGAIRDARGQGMHVGIESGYRPPDLTGSAYDAGGNSSHSYGLASDISGLDGANGRLTQQWATIAAAHGIYNPYGVGNRAEFNHYQFTPYPLEQRPDELAALKAAASSGDWNKIWAAAPGSAAPAMATTSGAAAPAMGTTLGGGSHAAFIRDYAQKIGLDPNLALGIANAEGLNAWSGKNPAAGSLVDVDKATGLPFSYGDFQLNVHPGAIGARARAAGIDPADPSQWQAADRFALDYMKAHGVGAWSGDPVAKSYLASGKVPAYALAAGSTLNTTGGPAAGSQTGSPSGAPPGPAGGSPTVPGAWGSGQPPGAVQPWQQGLQQAAKTMGISSPFGGAGQDDAPRPPPLPVPTPPRAAGGPMMLGEGGQNAAGQQAARMALAQQGFPTSPMPANFAPSGAIMPPIGAGPPGAPPAGHLAPGQASAMPAAGLPGTSLNSPSQLQLAMLYGAPPYGMPPGYGGMSGSY